MVNCLSRKFRQQFPVVTVKGCGKFQENLNRGFQFSLPKKCEIPSSGQEGQNFKFYWFVFSKRTEVFLDWIETRSEILLKLSTVLHCQERKLLSKFSAQVIYLLGKTNWWNLNFWLSGLLEEISQFSTAVLSPAPLHCLSLHKYCW